MRYVSTRGEAPALSFEETMLTGLAPDGGLYVPETVPVLSEAQIARMRLGSYEDAAYSVMAPFIGETFTEDEFRDLIGAAYEGFGHVSRAPLRQIDDGLWLLELFHGPTLAFKDFAMQLIGQMFQAVLKRNGRRITIVGATSGDTGSAAIEAFRGLSNVDVCILYPHGRVSEVQRRQMTTPSEGNVHALAVEGTFDDCQRHLKDMFADHAFRDEVGLAAVNSINWARVMAQVVYYFTSAVSASARPERQAQLSPVPTGQFRRYLCGRNRAPHGAAHRTSGDRHQPERYPRSCPARRLSTAPVRSSRRSVRRWIFRSAPISSGFLFDVYGRDGHAVAQVTHDLQDSAADFHHQSGRSSTRLRETFLKRMRSVRRRPAARIATTLAESARARLPPYRRRARGGASITTTSARSDGCARHRAPRQVPRCRGSGDRGSDRPLPKRMADLYDRSERVSRGRK